MFNFVSVFGHSAFWVLLEFLVVVVFVVFFGLTSFREASQSVNLGCLHPFMAI